MHKGTLAVNSSQKMELIDITNQIGRAVTDSTCQSGICHLYNPHTTAGITINEGADPAVQDDLITIFKRLIPESPHYKHLEGNSPAHAMTAMVGTSAMVFIDRGALKLGTWQRIFFCEFDGPRSRTLHWRIRED
ncbi:MAG: secondary thiamine-phosphate synthase enzyme YjbQ [Proteobacteria bacterium]|nr:YjbQ family protein [Desulfobulbaceae bacterium]MBU4153453.1 secondary thiamine-phosphate synthase enzyme YjbQ [Pseudomonadota bacterium]MDP2104910.1 secondary thiamine-phosphate synthase enzyme YjbQ [Desulfobulbaceae bacterium]